MTALSLSDQLFFILEKPHQPMHFAGLQLFSYPPKATNNHLKKLVKEAQKHTHPKPPFDTRMHQLLALRYWKKDPQFDLAQHVYHDVLPKGANWNDLEQHIAHCHQSPFSCQRPLWEVRFIEGFSDKQFAIYTRLHHAMMDGMSAMRLGLRNLSYDATHKDLPPLWESSPKRRPKIKKPLLNIRPPLNEIASLPKLGSALLQHYVPFMDDMPKAPACPLNQPVGTERHFLAHSWPLSRVHSIAKAHNGTINDVVLAICSQALRQLLIDMNALPDEPLVAMVPTSLRDKNSAGGNQVAALLVNLATHEADPIKRFAAIQLSVKAAKAKFCGLTATQSLLLTSLMLAPTAFNLITGLAPSKQAFNVVISNVPGPKETLYWNNNQLTDIYPVSIAMDQLALNITLTSYQDKLQFGLVACKKSLPNMTPFIAYLETALTDLESNLKQTPSQQHRA